MGNQLSQAAQRLDLEWTAGDPVSLSFRYPIDDLEGAYTAPVHDKEKGGDEVGTLVVTATFVPATSTEDAYTLFAMSMTEVLSADITEGDYWWALIRTNGPTIFHGRVNVKDGRL